MFHHQIRKAEKIPNFCCTDLGTQKIVALPLSNVAPCTCTCDWSKSVNQVPTIVSKHVLNPIIRSSCTLEEKCWEMMFIGLTFWRCSAFCYYQIMGLLVCRGLSYDGPIGHSGHSNFDNFTFRDISLRVCIWDVSHVWLATGNKWKCSHVNAGWGHTQQTHLSAGR